MLQSARLFNRSQKLFGFRLLSLMSVVRAHNILVLALAQYLSCVFILSEKRPDYAILLDPKVFFLVLAGTLIIAGGYIINNFYDYEKDSINRPGKSYMDRIVSRTFKLRAYLAFTTAGVLLSGFVSWRAVIFFSVYAMAVWLYSHKIKRVTLLGNIWAALLTIIPFFALFLYLKNFEPIVFYHATFLFLLVMAKELVKDLDNINGDVIYNYPTTAVKFGERYTKLLITLLALAILVSGSLLVQRGDIGNMRYYFYIANSLILLSTLFMWLRSDSRSYNYLHNFFRLIIFCGVLSIVLIQL